MNIAKFPKEVLFKIFLSLDSKSVGHASCACRVFRDIAERLHQVESVRLWGKRAKQLTLNQPKPRSISWRRVNAMLPFHHTRSKQIARRARGTGLVHLSCIAPERGDGSWAMGKENGLVEVGLPNRQYKSVQLFKGSVASVYLSGTTPVLFASAVGKLVIIEFQKKQISWTFTLKKRTPFVRITDVPKNFRDRIPAPVAGYDIWGRVYLICRNSSEKWVFRKADVQGFGQVRLIEECTRAANSGYWERLRRAWNKKT